MHNPDYSGGPFAARLLKGISRLPRIFLLDIAVLLIIFGITLLLQWASGAHFAALGAEPDEASHYVTGVMIRDYLNVGLLHNPITFAEEFYLHYPRVGFGLWPPLFHLFSGAWMLAFGTDRMSVMFMLAGLTTIWAFVLYKIGRPVIGTTGALISAVVLVFLPTTQKSTSAVMLDIPLAVMMLLAIAAYTRYLDTEKIADAFLFGLCAAVALLIKYNALALALLPPLCVVIAGKHYLWRTKSFWLPAAVVLVIAGPWYFAMRHLVRYAADPGGGLPPLATNLLTNAKGIVFVAGPVVFALAALGCVLMGVNMRNRLNILNGKHRSLYFVSAATVLAVFFFHGIYPLYESRYLLPVAPALIVLSWPAIGYMYSILVNRPSVPMAAFVFVVAIHAAATFAVPVKKTGEYVQAADNVLAAGLPGNGAVLVSADRVGEGMLTAEFVMRDHRPDHYVVRASKLLASQTLMGDDYRLIYQSPEEIMKALDSIPIEIVVIQQCPKGRCGEHENLLTQTVARYPQRWRLASVLPSETGSPILIYQITGNEGKSLQTLRIDMTHTLGTTLEKH